MLCLASWLETIGRGATATKHGLLASLASLAISDVTRLDGAVDGRWEARGLPMWRCRPPGAGIVVVTLVAVPTMGFALGHGSSS
jgi:Flp pilus assembly pilin Flp